MDRRLDHVSRRAFVVGAGAAGLGLLAGCGRLPGQHLQEAQQPTKIPRIGILTGVLAPSSPWLEAFREGLREHGWIPEQNVTLEYRSAEGDIDGLPALAIELAQIPVDAFLTGGPDAAQAARQASGTIPIVMGSTTDAVEEGLVANLARPGGNVTGLSQMRGELAGKRLEVLAQGVPSISRVALLQVDSFSLRNGRDIEGYEAASRSLGVQFQILNVPRPDAIEAALATASREGTRAVIVQGPVDGYGQTLIVDLAAKYQLASISERRDFAVAGGLMAYGPNGAAQYRRAAYYVDRILRGVKPADLPVEQPMTFDFVVNLRTAQALGITFPNEIMLQVTEVLQ